MPSSLHCKRCRGRGDDAKLVKLQSVTCCVLGVETLTISPTSSGEAGAIEHAAASELEAAKWVTASVYSSEPVAQQDKR